DNGSVFWYDSGTATTFLLEGAAGEAAADKPEVGTSISSGTATLDQDHVVVTIGFNDGSAQVVLDTYV
ncbi:MAG: hypothetical protein LUQ41_09085, partial [Methanomicrobiales archaeon]|nr:hypothetical protein [Methanomicrobiales archaeon]